MIKQPATLSMIVISLCPPLSPLVYSVRNLQAKLLLPGPFKTGADQVGTGPWPDGNDMSLLLSQRAPTEHSLESIMWAVRVCVSLCVCIWGGEGVRLGKEFVLLRRCHMCVVYRSGL